MLNEPVQPHTGPITIDLALLSSVLVDLMPSALYRPRTKEPSIDAISAKLEKGNLEIGAKAETSTNVRARHAGRHKRSSKSAPTASLTKRSRRRSKQARRRTRTRKK